jgi:hypothetical protein
MLRGTQDRTTGAAPNRHRAETQVDTGPDHMATALVAAAGSQRVRRGLQVLPDHLRAFLRAHQERGLGGGVSSAVDRSCRLLIGLWAGDALARHAQPHLKVSVSQAGHWQALRRYRKQRSSVQQPGAQPRRGESPLDPRPTPAPLRPRGRPPVERHRSSGRTRRRREGGSSCDELCHSLRDHRDPVGEMKPNR